MVKFLRNLHYRPSRCQCLILLKKFRSHVQEDFLFFLYVEWYFLLCHWSQLLLSMLRTLVCSSHNTSSCYDNNVFFSWIDINNFDVLIRIQVGILHRIYISHRSILPLHNQLWTLFEGMVKFFTIRTCLLNTCIISRKVSWLSTIITYDLASSSTKPSSSFFLSSASQISTSP